MHPALTTINKHLAALVAQVQSAVPNDEPFSVAQGNWSFPGLTRAELIEETQSLIDLIENQGGDEVGDREPRLQDYVRRLEYLRQNTVPQLWGQSAQAVSAYLFTLQGLRKALLPVLASDGHAEAMVDLKKLTRRLRGMEARLNELEPRTASLGTMLERIEQANDAADQLPTDLESLSEARQNIAELVKYATQDQGDVRRIREEAEELDKQLHKSSEDAKAVLDRCETAYAGSTSVGLAKAFSERSTALSKSMWFWVAGLIAALVSGSYFGSRQLHALSELLKEPSESHSMITLNLLLSALSVGAPVWFAWLATKQIGQRFRLAEDYAFKASISRAYEGFRREAARIDKDMEAKLLASALTRLDELPLRLVEADNHGSPWHELASSDVVKQAMKAVPDFAIQVKDLARGIIAATTTKTRSKPKSEEEKPASEDQ